MSDTGKVSAAAADSWVTVVSSLEGSTSLFVADGEAAVQSSYYDPREGAYEDHTVSSRMRRAVGGLVQTVNALVKANFPAGALPSDAVVALQPYAVPPQPTGEKVAIRSFALVAVASDQTPITTLDQSITLTVAFGDEEVTGLKVDELQLAFWDGAVWQALASQVGDHQLTAQVEHLSDFALLSTVAPPPAPEQLFLPAIHPQ